MALPALMLLAACAGDTTAPEAPTETTNTASTAPLGVRVLPDTVTIETDQRIRFRGELQGVAGEVYETALTWEATGGSIDADGYFSAKRPGTYRVIGRGRGYAGRNINGKRWDRGRTLPRQLPDTAIVIVVPPQPKLARIHVKPRWARVQVGTTHTFNATATLADGSKAKVGMTWKATGGTIDPSGVYQAGDVPGLYHVIAANTRGDVADTVIVRIPIVQAADSTATPRPKPQAEPQSGPQLEPEPEPEPQQEPKPQPKPEPVKPTINRVVLRPASVVLTTGSNQQFTAFGRSTAGDSIAVAVTFKATGGTITSTGLYTAGPTGGVYQVVATAEGQADTAIVTLARAAGGASLRGIPFGPYGAWSGSASLKSNTVAFTGTIGSVTANALVARINEARRRGITLLTAMTGGHDPYMTNGVFDMAKWKAAMDTYNTPTIRKAVADAVAEGVLIGNSVMDEPYVHGLGDGNTWGPKGTMTKARVDEMCRYVKNIFPTLPVGVVHEHHMFEPDKSYKVCEFIVSQYSHRFGDIVKFRDDALALGRRDNIAIAFSLNIMNGGIQAARDGRWACDPVRTAGRGTYEPNCRMTPEQIREWGLVLGEAGCALMMWRYDDSFMAKPENQRAFSDIAARLAALPRRPCTKA